MTKKFLAAFASAGILFAIGCEKSTDVVVDPPAKETSTRTESEATPDAATPDPTDDAAGEEPASEEPTGLVVPEQRGLDDEDPAIPEGLSTTPDRALLEALPAIGELPALSTETTIDEKTKLPFTKLGDFAIRDGVYVFRMVSPTGVLEMLLSVETQSNGFVARRGDRTRLRFVVDGDKATFASEPGSGEIAGRGKPNGDDWIRGSFRVKNADGTISEGTFELQKLYDLRTPRAAAPAPAAGPEAPPQKEEEASPTKEEDSLTAEAGGG